MPVASPLPKAANVAPPSIDLLSPVLPPTAKTVSPEGVKMTSSILPVKICVQDVPELVLLYNPLFPSAARSWLLLLGLTFTLEKYVEVGKPLVIFVHVLPASVD